MLALVSPAIAALVAIAMGGPPGLWHVLVLAVAGVPAVLYALRVPWAEWLVVVLGVGAMVLGVLNSGSLLLALWAVGGIWLAVGLVTRIVHRP